MLIVIYLKQLSTGWRGVTDGKECWCQLGLYYHLDSTSLMSFFLLIAALLHISEALGLYYHLVSTRHMSVFVLIVLLPHISEALGVYCHLVSTGLMSFLVWEVFYIDLFPKVI